MVAKASDLIGKSPRFHARATGLVGVLVLASGSLAGVVSSKLVVRGDVAATSRNVVASESLFRLGIVGSLVMMIAFLFYGLLLYRLLAPVNRNRAAAMVALVLVSVPIYMLNQVHAFGALLAAVEERQEQVKLFLDAHRFGNLVASTFFGAWLLPLGLLVLKSGFLPRLLGWLLIVGSPGYVVLFAQAFLFPGSEGTLWSNPFLVVTHLAEAATMLWLLIRGVDSAAWEARARESPGGEA
jgi:hypothetical protein